MPARRRAGLSGGPLDQAVRVPTRGECSSPIGKNKKDLPIGVIFDAPAPVRLTPRRRAYAPSSQRAARFRAGRARSARGRRARRRPRSAAARSVRISGTGLVVCAVYGLTPSSSSIRSALPWSAVTRHTPPAAAVASTTRPRQRVGRLDRCDHGGDRAGVPDHVRVGEVDHGEAVALADLLAEPVGHRGARTSPACGRSSARRAATARGSVSPPSTRPPRRR